MGAMDEPAADEIARTGAGGQESPESGAPCIPAASQPPGSEEAPEEQPPWDDALLRRLVCQAQRKLGLDRIVIALLDDERQELREAATVSASGEASPGRRTLCSLRDRDNPLAQLA